jgi:Flp pilus assembly protein TadG
MIISGNIAACVLRVLPTRLARRFVRQQDGAVAVEFAFVAIPFLALIFAIMETALVFFAGQTLETAVQDSARLIMTGQADMGGWSKDDFKTHVCEHIYGLFDCANGIYVDVKTFSDFGALNTELTDPTKGPVNNGQFDDSKLNYNPGGVGTIEVVRLYYQWPVYTFVLGNALANLNGSKRLLVATAVFRNEPYK